MSLTQNVATILNEHVTLEVKSIDRMNLNVYVPRPQWEEGVAGCFSKHLGQPVASSALMALRTRDFVAAIERFVKARSIPVVEFHKGERKDDVMAAHLRHFYQPKGVVFCRQGAGEDPSLPHPEAGQPGDGLPYPWMAKSTALVNHYYFYCLDRDFGPFFLKFCFYLPHNAKLCLSGHEYMKRQLMLFA